MKKTHDTAKQFDYFHKNDRYEVLTDSGFQDFDGLLEAKSNSLIQLVLGFDNIITCTLDHKVYITANEYVLAKDLKIGDCVYINKTSNNMIKNIITLPEKDEPVYDLLDVKNGNRFHLTKDKNPIALMSQCCYLDELSFVENAEEFFASTYPVITSGESTKIIITSTPKGMNLFHKMWVEAEQGKNGFVPIRATWREHPERDAEWADQQKAVIGERQFAQEFESLCYDTIININGTDMKIGELYEILS